MYYPKSEIADVKYTSGNEFVIKKTGLYYTGDYYATNDGKYFTGKEYTISTRELVKPFLSSPLNVIKTGYSFYYAVPTDKDYENGYFTRYVIKRVNSGLETITEVDQKEYERAKKDPLYSTDSFTWKITGPVYDDLTDKNNPVYGVLTLNQKKLEAVEKNVPGAKNYFSNLLQYYK